jgi:hypothetical protein
MRLDVCDYLAAMSSNTANFKNTSSKNSLLKAPFRRMGIYVNYARRHGRHFLKERVRETRTRIAPAPHRPVPHEWSHDALTVTWLGHATVLINFFGTWILTDPALRNRVGINLAGGLMTVGVRRLVQPALTIGDYSLPPETSDGALLPRRSDRPGALTGQA